MAKQQESIKPKIWCLFSVDNNYDQPDHNLVAWWPVKPSLEVLFKTLGVTMGENDEHTVGVVKVWSGGDEKVDYQDTRYRLRLVEEGKLPEGRY